MSLIIVESKEEGAAFLRKQQQDGFDFFSCQLTSALAIRKKEKVLNSKKKKKKLNAANRKQLACIYVKILNVLEFSDRPVFRETVPESEVAALLDHAQEVLQEKIHDAHWISTGTLLEHDQLLMDCYSRLLNHTLPTAMTFENTKTLEILCSMMDSRRKRRRRRKVGGASSPYNNDNNDNMLAGPAFVHNIQFLVAGLFSCSTFHFDNPWTTARALEKLEATGILEHYLHCAAMRPSEELLTLHKIIFQKLLCATKLVRKRFRVGTPCGDTLRAILDAEEERADSIMPAVCNLHMHPFLHTLIKLSTLLGVEDDDDDVDCQYCKKVNFRDEYMHCGRCKRVNYCSKKCQKADWKEHKKCCFEPDKADDFPRILSAGIRIVLDRAYVNIMVELVQECEKKLFGRWEMKDMMLEMMLCPNEDGMIPFLENSPQFRIIKLARYLDGSRPRALEVAENVEGEKIVNATVKSMVTTLKEKHSFEMSGESGILGSEIHSLGNIFQRHQLFTEDTKRPMFTQEALDAFRIAMFVGDYSRLSTVFESEELVESYKQEILTMEHELERNLLRGRE